MSDVILVDANDQSIGHMEIKAAHEGAGQLHRAISVYVFRHQLVDGKQALETLVQQRSPKKFTGAGLWGNTVCGNVRMNESYEECAHRRLREELTITHVHITPIYSFRYQVRVNEKYSENEIDHLFAGWYDDVVDPVPHEVSQYAWISWSELVKRAQTEYQVELLDQQKYLYSVKETTPDHVYTLAPWTVIMLHNQQLVTALNEFVNQ